MFKQLMEEFENSVNEAFDTEMSSGSAGPSENSHRLELEQWQSNHLARLDVGRDFIKFLAGIWKDKFGKVTARGNGFREWAKPYIVNSNLSDDQKAEAVNDSSKIISQWQEVDNMPANEDSDTETLSVIDSFKRGWNQGKKRHGKKQFETASCGGTSAGGIAGAAQPMGTIRKRTNEEPGPVNRGSDADAMLAAMQQSGGGTMRFLFKPDGSIVYQIEDGKWNNGRQPKLHGSRVEEEDYVNAGKGMKKNSKPPHATMKTPSSSYLGNDDKKVG